MISGRLSAPSHSTAVSIRVLAAVTTTVSAVLIPWAAADAILGHIAPQAAVATVAIAATLTLATVVVARALDPLRH